MNRRAVIVGIAGAAVTRLRVASAAEGDRRPLIGYLEAGRMEAMKERDAAFLAGMHDLGYRMGKSFDIVYRFADDDYGRLEALANELVQLKPDVIVTAVTTAALAAAKVTRTVPIVSVNLNDPVQEGVVASYPHPGGNVTGITNTVEGLPGKLVEIALELMPRATRIGFLLNPANPIMVAQWREIEAAAAAKGVKPVRGEVRSDSDLPSVFKSFSGSGIDVVIVSRDTVLLGAAPRVAELALAAHLPTIAAHREEVRAGDLISYGVNLLETTRRAAYFVDRILKGARPADLPVEFPTKLEMAINLKTAKALGLAIPQTLLLSADEVIE